MCQRERYDSYRAVIQKRYLRDTGLKAILKLSMIAAMVKSCTVNTSKKRRQAIIQAPRNTKKGGKAKKNAKKLWMKKNRKPNQPR